MKITVVHEIPDEEDCRTCMYHRGKCIVFNEHIFAGSSVLSWRPCPACMEARKRKEK